MAIIAKTFTVSLEGDGRFRTRPPLDTTAPSVPVIASAAAQGSTSALWSWFPSTDLQTGVAGYRVRLDGVEVTSATSLVTQTSYLGTGFGASTTHTLEVAAQDTAGNVSAYSAGSSVTTGAATGVVVKPLHYDNFEGAAVDASKTDTTKRWMIADDYDATQDPAIALSTNRARNGTKSARVQLSYTKSAGTVFTVNGGKTNESGHRNELNGNRAWATTGWNGITQFGIEYWYGVSIYRPASGDAFGDPEWTASPYPTYEILVQWHDSPDSFSGTATSTTSTTVVLPASASSVDGFYRGSISIGGQSKPISSYTGSTRTVTVSSAFSPTPAAGAFTITEQSRNPMLVLSVDRAPGGAGTNRTNWNLRTAWQSARFGNLSYDGNTNIDLGSWAADNGTWTDWIFRVVWSATAGSGILQVWKNGTLVVSRINTPNAYNDFRAPYAIPIGFYCQPYNPTTQTPAANAPGIPARRVAYYDQWIMAQATGNSTTAAVDNTNAAYLAIANWIANGVLP